MPFYACVDIKQATTLLTAAANRDKHFVYSESTFSIIQYLTDDRRY